MTFLSRHSILTAYCHVILRATNRPQALHLIFSTRRRATFALQPKRLHSPAIWLIYCGEIHLHVLTLSIAEPRLRLALDGPIVNFVGSSPSATSLLAPNHLAPGIATTIADPIIIFKPGNTTSCHTASTNFPAWGSDRVQGTLVQSLNHQYHHPSNTQ